MSRADEIRAKVAQTRQAETEPEPDPESDRSAVHQRPRVKPVRRTVDLSAAHHAALDQWCGETAQQLGRARVTGQDVLRTLVARLLTDETLARKIRQDLADDQKMEKISNY